MVNLPNVTIVGVAGTMALETLKAIRYSMKKIKFGASKLITPYLFEKKITDVEVVECEPLNYEQYNHFIVYRLQDYIHTSHCLLVQNDGYVVNSHMWQDSWLDYDYIGALWPLPKDDYSFKDPRGNIQRVGNGGFTLRSKKLLGVAKYLNLKWEPFFGYYHEDGFYCVHHRSDYENQGCKFAPIEVAAKFSHELAVSENSGIVPFGFHGKDNFYYEATKRFIK